MDRNMTPLADRMRPRTLDEFIGQEQIVGKGRLLRRAIDADRLGNCLFYGPPGCGKTTLASVIANSTHSELARLNAVTSGVAELREVLRRAETERAMTGRPTLLLLDECHRWNKAQSDALLPALEKGLIHFIGSTTENPMISMTPALVSRCRIFRFTALTAEDIRKALNDALKDEERGFGRLDVLVDEEAMRHIAVTAAGDARNALNALELAVLTTPPEEGGRIHVDLAAAEESIQRPVLQMDESYFYDMLSAFCKSLRGSDSDAALAWFARMLEAGVDPHILARRMIVHASEDVGMASPNALLMAVAAAEALDRIGLPEARLNLAEAIIYICESPKSDSVAAAVDKAFAAVGKAQNEPVPIHLRDTHYAGHTRIESGKGYLYPHDFPGHYVEQQYLPDSAKNDRYYFPSDQGNEARIREIRKSRGKDAGEGTK